MDYSEDPNQPNPRFLFESQVRILEMQVLDYLEKAFDINNHNREDYLNVLNKGLESEYNDYLDFLKSEDPNLESIPDVNKEYFYIADLSIDDFNKDGSILVTVTYDQDEDEEVEVSSAMLIFNILKAGSKIPHDFRQIVLRAIPTAVFSQFMGEHDWDCT